MDRTDGPRIVVTTMVAAAQDVAALDCVSFAHLRRFEGALAAGLRVVAWSPDSPSLPLITARTTDASSVTLEVTVPMASAPGRTSEPAPPGRWRSDAQRPSGAARR